MIVLGEIFTFHPNRRYHPGPPPLIPAFISLLFLFIVFTSARILLFLLLLSLSKSSYSLSLLSPSAAFMSPSSTHPTQSPLQVSLAPSSSPKSPSEVRSSTFGCYSQSSGTSRIHRSLRAMRNCLHSFFTPKLSFHSTAFCTYGNMVRPVQLHLTTAKVPSSSMIRVSSSSLHWYFKQASSAWISLPLTSFTHRAAG